MGIIRQQLKGAEIVIDQDKPWRIYGAIGEGARSWALRPGLPCDDTTNEPTEFITTLVEAGAGDSSIAAGAAAGYPLKLTTDNAEYDGLNVQLRGESFKLDADTDARIRAVLKPSEEDDSDLLFGFAELKTDLMKTSTAHGVTATNVEGVFFVKPAGETKIYVEAYKNGTRITSIEVGDLAADDNDLALWWDGSNVRAYLADVEVARFAGTLPDGELTPSINFRTGAAAAITLEFAELAFAAVKD